MLRSFFVSASWSAYGAAALAAGLPLVVLAACHVDGEQGPSIVGPQPQPVQGYRLVYEEPCSVDECEAAGPPASAGVHRCTRAFEAGACRWETEGADTSVSFRACEEARCGAVPTIRCPEGLELGGQQCGAENDDPCRWHSSCGVAPSDVPCAEAECPQERIAIAAICSEDGGFEGPVAEWKCRQTRFGCFWQAVCE